MRVSYKISVAFLFFLSCLVVKTYAQDVQNAENAIMMAVQELNQGEIESAEKMLTEILDYDPQNDAAWYYLSEVAIRKNDAESAEIFLMKAIEQDQGNFWYRLRLAKLYSLTQRTDQTIEMYESLLEDFPKKDGLYYDLFEVYYSNKDYESALSILDELEKELGMTEVLVLYRSEVLRLMGRQEDALSSLVEYNKKYSSPYVLSTLAEYEMSMYNDSTALAYYNEALDLEPDYSPALIGKAEVLRMTRQYDEFFPVLQEYIGSKYVSSGEKMNYMMELMNRSDLKFLRLYVSELDHILDIADQTHPGDSLVTEATGYLYHYTNRPAEAREKFHENVNNYPQNIETRVSFIEYLMYIQEWESLSKEAIAAFEVFPDENSFLAVASLAEYNMGNYEEVIRINELLLEKEPDNLELVGSAYSSIADAYYIMGNARKSFKAYEKAIKADPDEASYLNNYAYYLSEEGKKLKKAYNMSKLAILAEPDNATYLDTFGWILYLQGKPHEAKPFFKQAMIYGGKEEAVILDHYAEVLYALKEYDLAFVYWNMAVHKDNGDVPGLKEKIEQKKAAVK